MSATASHTSSPSLSIRPGLFRGTSGTFAKGWAQLNIGNLGSPKDKAVALPPTAPIARGSTDGSSSLEEDALLAARILRTFSLDGIDILDEDTAPSLLSSGLTRRIPTWVFERATGVVLFSLKRTKGGKEGAKGYGVVLSKKEEGWSAPASVAAHLLGEQQLEEDVYDVLLVLFTASQLAPFLLPKITLGTGSYLAGPLGAAPPRTEELEPVSYIKSRKGASGLELDGLILLERSDEHARLYGPDIAAEQVLDGDVPTPVWCESLHEVLRGASGLSYDLKKIAVGPSPAECESEEPATPAEDNSTEDEDDDDAEARRQMQETLRELGIEDLDINSTLRNRDPLLRRGSEAPSSTAGAEAAEQQEEEDANTPPPLSPDNSTRSRSSTMMTPSLYSSSDEPVLSSELNTLVHGKTPAGTPRPDLPMDVAFSTAEQVEEDAFEDANADLAEVLRTPIAV